MSDITASTSPRTKPAKAAFAGFLGTTIEWYDFFLFGSAAPLVFNKAFFPSLDPTAGTLAAFATFGVAFVARPVGGVVFGHFGDRLGRKSMLVLSLLMMGGATVVIGILPTYATFGIWAPLLLVSARVVQGIAVGGEWGGAVLMSVEHAPPNRKTFYGSWPQAGVPAGLVLAAGALYLAQLAGPDAFAAWAWRVPFLASVILIGIGLYIRLSITESPDFRFVERTGQKSAVPLVDVLRTSRKQVVVGALVQVGANVPFYVASVFVLSYARELNIPSSIVLLGIVVAAVLDIAAVPAAALLAERWGQRRVLILGSGYVIAVVFPFFWLFETGSPVLVGLALILVLTGGHSLTYAAIAAYLAQLFEPAVRYTGTSVAYQFGGMVASGPAPLIAAALLGWAGGSWIIALYIVLACTITLVALTTYRPRTTTSAVSERGEVLPAVTD